MKCFTTQANPIIANIETNISINLPMVIPSKLLLYFIVNEDTQKQKEVSYPLPLSNPLTARRLGDGRREGICT
jgi:hypothetical protein